MRRTTVKRGRPNEARLLDCGARGSRDRSGHPVDGHRHSSADRLSDDEQQSGYFTAAQARSHGVTRQVLSHHVRQGWFVRLRRGLASAASAEPCLGTTRGRATDRGGTKIIAVTDNPSTRGTEEVQQWLAAHPRWSFQYTPTHASWLNQIEIVFSILARRPLKHGIFTSEDDLAQQMLAFIETYSQTAKPFAWTYTDKTLSA